MPDRVGSLVQTLEILDIEFLRAPRLLVYLPIKRPDHTLAPIDVLKTLYEAAMASDVRYMAEFDGAHSIRVARRHGVHKESDRLFVREFATTKRLVEKSE